MEEMLKELRDFNRRIRRGVELSDEERKRYLELYDRTVEFISSIDNDYAVMCLSERYINGRKWTEIAENFGQYTIDSIRKYTSRAVRKYS